MKYLEFEVKNMTLNRKNGDKTTPISGAVNYFGVSVAFDEDFETIPGGKLVEFFKNKVTERRDLIDGKCSIPNEFLKDKDSFEMRVVSGRTVATPWVKISITESGPIAPEEPGEDAPESMEYVKTLSGDSAVPYLRAGTNGLEFSHTGEDNDWEGALSGVPEVPAKPKGVRYMRVHGDWVPYEEPEAPEPTDTTELQEQVNANTEAVEKIPEMETKISEMETKISENEQAISDLKDIEGLTGTASALTELAEDEADPAVIAAKVNEIIALLKARGIAN